MAYSLYMPTRHPLEGMRIIPVENLAALVGHLRGDAPIPPSQPPGLDLDVEPMPAVDFSAMRDQEHVKRALEVAAAGRHNVLMSGAPGAGKTLLARALPGIMPRMTPEESLEATKIFSVAGMLPPDQPVVRERPFRAPHYTISNAGLVGGGGWPRPGEPSIVGKARYGYGCRQT